MPDTLCGHRLTLLFTAAQIDERVSEMGSELTALYAGKSPVFIGILRGSFVFLADLVRRVDTPMEIDFISMTTYGGGTTPGPPRLLYDTRVGLEGRDVLLVDDILDTGSSLLYAREHILAKGPASLRVCALLENMRRRSADVQADLTGFTFDHDFVVGYGLDWAGHGRGLPDIYVIDTKKAG